MDIFSETVKHIKNYVYGKQLKSPRDHVYPSLAFIADALLARHAIRKKEEKLRDEPKGSLQGPG